jgi:hypothetical protein
MKKARKLIGYFIIGIPLYTVFGYLAFMKPLAFLITAIVVVALLACIVGGLWVAGDL